MDYKIKLRNINSNTEIVKISDDAVGFVLSKIIRESSKQIFFHITSNDVRMKELEKQIGFFLPEIEVLTFPAWDCMPFDRVSPNSAIVATRIKTISRLIQKTSEKLLIITTINAVLQKTIPRKFIENFGLGIAVGDEIKLENLINYLIDNGYSRNSTANNIGEFAVRGSIVDVIIQGNLHDKDDLIGYRMDFFGDNLESIRIFDPLSQITSNKINKINFLPVSEINLNQKSINNFRNNYRALFGIPGEDLMYEAIISGRLYPGMEHWMPLFYEDPLDNIFSYFNSALVSIEDKALILKDERIKIIEDYYKSRIDTAKESKNSGGIYNPLKPNYLYLNNEEFEAGLNKNLLIKFNNFENSSAQRSLDLEIKPSPDFVLASKTNNKNNFELMKLFISEKFSNQKILMICFSQGSRERMQRILLEREIASGPINNFNDLVKLPKNYIGLGIFPIKTGFYGSDIIVIGETSLLGDKENRTINKKINGRILGEALALQIGELVVHRYHGIGKFDGLHTISAGGLKNDFLKIIYGGGDALFVPVEDIGLITRYGADNPMIQLDRLGTAAWKNRKEKIRKRIKVAAEELIKIAAQRQMQKAPIFLANPGEYEEFKSRFGFIETDDQLKVIAEIEEDLIKAVPMDRLVCGDVGFGKTEVAMRAAFIVAKNDRTPIEKEKVWQVAIVTPTTLLSRQHYHNFKTRFKETGLQIEQLSRMVPTALAKKIKEDLEFGKINIIIGTHALLSKNIKFKNLALVIIDEEQHFGVAQKERLKELRNEVHILTLSATPIPRTLQMALSGVKELSIIATPPADRLAIRSFVMPYDSVIVKEAIMREYQRGGKTFFVVPKIRDINEIEDRLKRLIPDVKIRSAHGQMAPGTLDQIMNDFYDGKFDVLLSTTIIESGIDITSANTIIIHKAEMFGLSQLYQLRGRVGRGKIRAYSYLMTSVNRILKDEAGRKLEVMQTLDSLGAGFSIASHDMDIRGSGNILGDEQSGHIRETGVELYQDMLNEAIANLKNNNPKTIEIEEESDYIVQIKLGVSLLISEDYISDLALRLSFYKRIGTIKSKDEGEKIAIEMIDRFGELPLEINNLLEISYLKNLCKKCDIEKIESNIDGILISFKNNKFKEPEKLLELVFGSKNQIKLFGPKLLFITKIKNDQEKLQQALKITEQINNLIK